MRQMAYRAAKHDICHGLTMTAITSVPITSDAVFCRLGGDAQDDVL